MLVTAVALAVGAGAVVVVVVAVVIVVIKRNGVSVCSMAGDPEPISTMLEPGWVEYPRTRQEFQAYLLFVKRLQ
eukprot:1142557-Pelagomonas_calceolata.AAC.3